MKWVVTNIVGIRGKCRVWKLAISEALWHHTIFKRKKKRVMNNDFKNCKDFFLYLTKVKKYEGVLLKKKYSLKRAKSLIDYLTL